jgi:hypothetical protein
MEQVSLLNILQTKCSIEGILYFNDDGFRQQAYEFHGDISGAPGLKWYGPGKCWIYDYDIMNPTMTAIKLFGIDGVIGLDFKFIKHRLIFHRLAANI